MWTKENGKQEQETWWWDQTVENLVKHKRKLRIEWQKGGRKEKFIEAKSKAKSDVYETKYSKMDQVKFVEDSL